jgi:drug/metabolite transporter (DMT)-like permease
VKYAGSWFGIGVFLVGVAMLFFPQSHETACIPLGAGLGFALSTFYVEEKKGVKKHG